MFSQVFVCPQGGISVQGVSVQGGLCPGGLCLGFSLQGGLYSGESLSKGVSVQGGLCQGDPPYSNARAVRILLECILI